MGQSGVFDDVKQARCCIAQTCTVTFLSRGQVDPVADTSTQ